MLKIHKHTTFEVVFQAKNCIQLDQAPSSGCLFTLVPPECMHATAFSMSDPLYCTSFTFSLEAPSGYIPPFVQTLLSIDQPCTVVDNFGGVDLLRHCTKTTCEYETSITLMHLLIRMLAELPALKSSRGRISYGSNASQYIEEYIDQHKQSKDCTSKNLADEMHISERQLYRILQAFFRCSFRELLLKARMQTAWALLHSSSCSIEEVLEQTGYSSFATLSKAYRSYFGEPIKKNSSRTGAVNDVDGAI